MPTKTRIGIEIDDDGDPLLFAYTDDGEIISRCKGNTVWAGHPSNIDALEADFQDPAEFEREKQKIETFLRRIK